MPNGSRTLDRIVERNIQTLREERKRLEERTPRSVHLADRITRGAGSVWSIAIHTVVFGGWMVLNSGWVAGVAPWDPYPFELLITAMSAEAIYLTIFVLLSQNRMQQLDQERAELDLQINLLAEYEITRLLSLVDDIASHLGVASARSPALEPLKEDIAPGELLDRLDDLRDRPDA
jgi:uncharacterized membrane protein